jgi:hypothetical protein
VKIQNINIYKMICVADDLMTYETYDRTLGLYDCWILKKDGKMYLRKPKPIRPKHRGTKRLICCINSINF